MNEIFRTLQKCLFLNLVNIDYFKFRKKKEVVSILKNKKKMLSRKKIGGEVDSQAGRGGFVLLLWEIKRAEAKYGGHENCIQACESTGVELSKGQGTIFNSENWILRIIFNSDLSNSIEGEWSWQDDGERRHMPGFFSLSYANISRLMDAMQNIFFF